MTSWADVWHALSSHIGFVEGPGNVNPWTQAMGFGNCAYCSAFASVCPHQQAGVQWPNYVQVPPVGEAYSPNWSHFPSWAFDHASVGQPVDLAPGDVTTYDWNFNGVADHTETVVQVYADGTFDTIGANTGSPEGVHYPIRRDRRYLVGRYRPSAAGVWAGSPAPGPGPAPAPPPPPAPRPSGPRVLSQGMTGQDVSEWQYGLNRVGSYNLAVDGDFGPQTDLATRDFQGKHNCAVDGQVGPQSRTAMAAALNQPQPGPAPAPPPPPPPPPPPSGPNLVVDGQLGPATISALQARLNVTEGYSHGAIAVDGQMGPATIRYMQQRLNWSNGPVAIDGQLGSQTVRALQAHVGAGVDGGWGPDTTRHLQSALNAGTF